MKTSQQFTRDEIVEKLQLINSWLEGIKIDFIVLGGSVAKNTNQWWSDIDLFISLPNFNTLSASDFMKLYEKANYEILKHSKLENIEITVIQTLPIRVKFDVIKHGILLHENVEGIYSKFKYDTMKEYYDYKIWIDSYYEKVSGTYD